jgi:PAS domain S-box-containing protein
VGNGQTRFRADQASAMQLIGDILEVGVLSIDRSFTVTGWNQWLEAATGKVAADVIGQSITVVDPNLRPAARSALQQALDGSPVLLSHRLHGHLLDMPARRGTERYTRMQQSARIIPVYGADGTPSGAVALIHDVTERVAREEDVREALAAAQAANLAKSNFLAAMSHELRTPIGAMSAYADLLKDGILGSVTDVQHEHLLRIKTVASHLLGIVGEILTFARIEAGREQVRLVDADGVQLTREAILAVEPLVTKRGLVLRFDLPAAPVPMRTDPVKVRQILINLLGNAVKFTAAGHVFVAVTPSADGATVAFRIADSGQGIAADDLGRIFEPFVQISKSYSRTHEGTGLGLSVSRMLARLMGGDLTVESELGVGSAFTAVLPR